MENKRIRTTLDYDRLVLELQTNFSWRKKLFKILKRELTALGYWQNKKRGDPVKGYKLKGSKSKAECGIKIRGVDMENEKTDCKKCMNYVSCPLRLNGFVPDTFWCCMERLDIKPNDKWKLKERQVYKGADYGRISG